MPDKPSPADAAVERIEALLREVDDVEPRLQTDKAGEVELTLLERATELVERAGRVLERIDREAD